MSELEKPDHYTFESSFEEDVRLVFKWFPKDDRIEFYIHTFRDGKWDKEQPYIIKDFPMFKYRIESAYERIKEQRKGITI